MVKIYKNPVLKGLEGSQGKHGLPLTLSVAFYNHLPMLDLTLAAIEKQSFREFLVVICDDGSKPEIVSQLQARLDKFSLPVMHLWHEDKGFRKNRIMNWAIHLCETESIVFIDQDCMPHREFMHEHFKNRQKHSVLCGRRMDLTSWVSKMLTPEKVRRDFVEKNLWWIIPTGLYMKDNNGGKGLYFRNPWLRSQANKKDRGIVGCNFSVFREDMLAINGFDFRYEGAGTGEDSDIEYRLKLLGVKMQPFCNTAVQYHIWHKLLKRPNINEEIFANVQREGHAVTSFGLREQLQGQ
jgi:glycosyltransferase involved in cell wall biosynthesis